MANKAANSLPAFGFLTFVEDQHHGFFGGYLVLSELGRPLEFHCSTPILPNKAQKILYGSTLRSYVLGELIGQTLVKKAQLAVQMVLTDSEEMLGLSLVWSGMLAAITSQQPTTQQNHLHDFAAHSALDLETQPPRLTLDNYQLRGSTTCQWQPNEVQQLLAPLISYVDLNEPFQRIREAIQEAQRVTEHPAELDDDTSAAA